MPKTVTFDEAVRDAAILLAAAESGETIEITRAGKTAVVIAPALKSAGSAPTGGLRSRGFRNR